MAFAVAVSVVASGGAAKTRNTSVWTVDRLALLRPDGTHIRVEGYLEDRYFTGSELQPFRLVSAQRNTFSGQMECGGNSVVIRSPEFYAPVKGADPQHVILSGRYQSLGGFGASLSDVKLERVLLDHCKIIVRVRLGSHPSTSARP